MGPKVTIILLNWNQYKDTEECLSSLAKIEYKNFNLILVDNGSNDGSADKLAREFPQVKLIKNQRNFGFAKGNNIGIRDALTFRPDYILLLNNDTVVEPDFLTNLVAQAADITSPLIMTYDQPEKVWFGGGGFWPIIKKPYHIKSGRRGETEWISGCAMLIRSEVFKKIGLLDADYFNNYEDVDFCLRAKKAGFRIAVAPQAKIYHKFAASMGGKFSPFYTYYRTRNNLLFFKKTRQWLPLILNFLIFPAYSFGASLLRGNFKSAEVTCQAVIDFLTGKVGPSYEA